VSMALRFEQRLAQVLVCGACGGDHGVGDGHWPRQSLPRDLATGALSIPALVELNVCPVCFTILPPPVDWAPILKHYEKLQRRKGLREYRREYTKAKQQSPVPPVLTSDRPAWLRVDGLEYPVTIVAETAQRYSVRAESLIPITSARRRADQAIPERWILVGGFALVPKSDCRPRDQ